MRTLKQPRQSYGQENALNTDAQNLSPKEMSDRFVVLVTAFLSKEFGKQLRFLPETISKIF